MKLNIYKMKGTTFKNPILYLPSTVCFLVWMIFYKYLLKEDTPVFNITMTCRMKIVHLFMLSSQNDTPFFSNLVMLRKSLFNVFPPIYVVKLQFFIFSL